MPYFAHREDGRFYLLSAHLAWVAAGAAERLRYLPREAAPVEAAVLAGLAHDFGKYTSFFQRYLRSGRGGPEKQHAFLSGLWAARLAEVGGLADPLRLALFLAVVRHHRGLADLESCLISNRQLARDWAELEPDAAQRLRLVGVQVEDLRQNLSGVARSLAVAAHRAKRLLGRRGLPAPQWLEMDWRRQVEAFLAGWVAVYGGLYRAWRSLKRQDEDGDLANYLEVLALFSALIDADKIHAARVNEPARPALPFQPVEAYRATRFRPPANIMDELREDLFRTVMERVQKAPEGQHLFTLTAPTGSGKTLAGLAAAFYLRMRRAQGGQPPARVIYALPFTSIVDQVFSVAEAVLKAASGAQEVPSSWLLKHHHLADPVYRTPGGQAEEQSLDVSLLLIESWQSEMVVTTFVQVLETLIGAENRMLKKFHRLGGAVLILDEVQNIPVEYWPLVTAVLRQAAERLDMCVVLMTATRPEWFRPGDAWELAGDPEAVRRRFSALDRVGVEVGNRLMTVSQGVECFLENHRSDRAYLVVLNTIKSSIAFYRALREAWGTAGPPLYYLSTNIVPADRERRLREIRARRERGEKLVLVSTQVVEAGVDLDFDEVWRDLGPVDAVVQVAGRCNRHLRSGRGTVRLIPLVDDRPGREERLLAGYVYGPIHTSAAQRLFRDRPALFEPDFYGLVADYFGLVRQAKSSAKSEALLRAMSGLRFSREKDEAEPAVADFSLIERLPDYVDVFVCVDAEAEAVWNRYCTEVAAERDMRRRARAFLALKRDFRRYLLSVPAEALVHRLSADQRPLCIPGYLVREFYDPETGFISSSPEQVWIV